MAEVLTGARTSGPAPRNEGRFDLVELWALGQYVDQLVREEMRRHGIAGDLLAVLAYLARGPMTTSELAAGIGQAFMTVSDHVRRLEGAGEVRRRRHPTDGRARLVMLTTRGRRRLAAAGPHVAQVERSVRGHLTGSPERVRAAVADLRRAVELAAADMELEG